MLVQDQGLVVFECIASCSMLAGGSLPIARAVMQLFGCIHATRMHACNSAACLLLGCMSATRLHACSSAACVQFGCMHANRCAVMQHACCMHACKLLAAVQWNRCAVVRLNSCAVMRVRLWDQFGIVRQTRGVDILSELVVGVCPEESHGIVLGESLLFASATLLVELDPVGGCAWDEN